MDKVTFFVPGKPRTKGSQKWVKSKHTGKSVPVTNEGLETWCGMVATFAQRAMVDGGFARVDDGGVEIELFFVFERPKSHYRTGKNAHLLKDSAPERHTQKPDPDKLERAMFDSLTGIIYRDDCQIDDHHTRKAWGTRGGAHITVKGVFCAVQG